MPNGKPWTASQTLQSPARNSTGLSLVSDRGKSKSRASEVGLDPSLGKPYAELRAIEDYERDFAEARAKEREDERRELIGFLVLIGVLYGVVAMATVQIVRWVLS